MSGTYDTRPDLRTYDALTVRGLLKFALLCGAILAVQVAADRFELKPWLDALIATAWIAAGAWLMWIGARSWIWGTPLPDDPVAPRYAEVSINWVSPRVAAIGEIVFGALTVAQAVFKLIEILSE